MHQSERLVWLPGYSKSCCHLWLKWRQIMQVSALNMGIINYCGRPLRTKPYISLRWATSPIKATRTVKWYAKGRMATAPTLIFLGCLGGLKGECSNCFTIQIREPLTKVHCFAQSFSTPNNGLWPMILFIFKNYGLGRASLLRFLIEQ